MRSSDTCFSTDNPLFLLKDFIKTVTSLNFGEDGVC